MNVLQIRELHEGAWTERPDGFWLGARPEEIRVMARTLRGSGARFAAIVASPGAGGIRLSWHFDLRGTLLSIESTLASGAPAPSIVDLYPGADWAERETHDYFAVPFEGRADTPPLVRRQGEAPGVMLVAPGGRS